MTRKELAKEIYRMSAELGIIEGRGESKFVKRVLNQQGLNSKAFLTSWYNNLIDRLN